MQRFFENFGTKIFNVKIIQFAQKEKRSTTQHREVKRLVPELFKSSTIKIYAIIAIFKD